MGNEEGEGKREAEAGEEREAAGAFEGVGEKMKAYYQDGAVTIYHGCKTAGLVVDCYYDDWSRTATALSAKTQGRKIGEVEARTQKGFRAISGARREAQAIRVRSSLLEGRQHHSQERAESRYSFVPQNRAVYFLRGEESGAPSFR